MVEHAAETIAHNIAQVTERIDLAAERAGRDPASIHLVVVTKSQPVEVLQAAIEGGAGILGENYPEETLGKMNVIEQQGYEKIEWHMIGHVQSRKAHIIADHFDMLESLDSFRLAEKLERLLAERNRVMPVLLEFNVGGEESKFGWRAWDESTWDSLLQEIEPILHLPHLQVRGLMTMPPLHDNPEESRPYFIRLRRLSEFFSARFGKEYFQELSMGTSTDFEIAVQEGATLVRIGTVILGKRPGRQDLQDIMKL